MIAFFSEFPGHFHPFFQYFTGFEEIVFYHLYADAEVVGDFGAAFVADIIGDRGFPILGGQQRQFPPEELQLLPVDDLAFRRVPIDARVAALRYPVTSFGAKVAFEGIVGDPPHESVKSLVILQTMGGFQNFI